jgi:IMP cyclohydrolase
LKTELENLAVKEYPGRVIILGKDPTGKKAIVVYAITGRSPSSQARKLEKEGDFIWAKPTDEDILKTGQADLLVYPAVYLGRGVVVSNGKHTSDIIDHLEKSPNPASLLQSALSAWDYEPDAPIFTPRISGCVLTLERAALSVIRRGPDSSPVRDVFECSMVSGHGNMVTTYQGENRHPVPSFSGDPLSLEIPHRTCRDMAEAVYEALGPAGEGLDFRVAVACVFSSSLERDDYEVSIINRCERKGEAHA